MKPEWEIGKREFLERLGCSESEFAEHLALQKLTGAERIVPLKHLRKATSATPIPFQLLGKLLKRVKTVNGELPFKNATFELSSFNPNHLLVGQRFVYRENYQNLLEELPGLFENFAIPSGVTQLGAFFFMGRDRDGGNSMALYLPPIVEQHEDLVMMDGIYRNYLARQLGTTMCAIVIKSPSVPFPCEPHRWQDIRVISIAEKPHDINDRYFGFRGELFRDLKYLGIDG